MDYYSIENPLNDDVLKNIIIRYKDKSDVYSIITKMNSDKKVHREKYVKAARDRIYKIIYSEWRDGVLNPNPVRINTINPDDLEKLQSLLLSKPTIETEEEYDAFVNNNPLIEKYAWSKHGNNTAWTHINSNNIYTGQNMDWVTEHKLYINTDGVEDCVVEMFVLECIKKGLPYYVKYSPNISRDDMIVIYSDGEHLNDYIKILDTIFKDNPWLAPHMCEPPVLTGKIGDYIGYGSEPTTKGESYHQKRARIIEDALKDNLYMWYLKYMDIFDYVLKEAIEDACKDINEEDLNGIINQIKLGLVNYDLDKKVPGRFDYNSGNKTITIYTDMIENKMRKYITYILENDPIFFESVKNDILRLSKEKGIDDNFCFDVDRKALLLNSGMHK